MKKTFLSISVCLVITLFLASCGSKSVDLGFNPAQGSKYRMVITTDQNIKQEMMGQKVDVNSVSENTMLYETGKVNGDFVDVKMTFERMKTTQKAMGKEMVMDSDQSDTANPASKIISSIKGATFSMQVSKKGEIKNITGMDALMERMLKSAGENMPPEVSAQMREGVKSIMNEDMLKGMMEQSFKVFPPKTVKTGESWTSKIAVHSVMDMNVATTYTLKKIENGIASLDLKSVITPNGTEKTIQGTKVEVSLGGTQTGTMDMEVASGMTMKSTIVQKMDGKMKANGMEIPMNIQGTTSIKTTKL